MTRNLIRYPDPTIRLISANVRFFNDELTGWITDMVDTMRANDLNALSAILIGIQYNVIVIKEKEHANSNLKCNREEIEDSGLTGVGSAAVE